MRLAIAVALGSAGALAVPWAIRSGESELVDFLQNGLVQAHIGGFHFAWSWLVFCVVTLFTWAMLKWAG